MNYRVDLERSRVDELIRQNDIEVSMIFFFFLKKMRLNLLIKLLSL